MSTSVWLLKICWNILNQHAGLSAQENCHYPKKKQTVLKDLLPSPLSWNITTTPLQNLKFGHILWGKMWQQVCVFLKREFSVDAAFRPGLICFSGEDVVSAGGLCWWVDCCWCWGFCWIVVFVPVSLWYRNRLVLFRKPVPAWVIIRPWAHECLKVSFVKFSQGPPQNRARQWW